MMPAPSVLFGGSGRFGKAFLAAHPDWVAPTHCEVDITDPLQVNLFFAATRPTLVIHAAAIVGRREAERDTGRAYRVNVEGTHHIAQACAAYGCRLVYISSVAVFDGRAGPYSETDVPVPPYFYGWTKLAGEQVAATHADHVIIRTDFFVPDAFRYPRAFTDHYCSKMPIGELVPAVHRIATSAFRGVIHVGAPRDTLHAILSRVMPGIEGIRIADSEMPDFPRDLSLDTSRYRDLFATDV